MILNRIFHLLFLKVANCMISEYYSFDSRRVSTTYVIRKINGSSITSCQLSCGRISECFEAGFPPEIMSEHTGECFLLSDYKNGTIGDEFINLLVITKEPRRDFDEQKTNNTPHDNNSSNTSSKDVNYSITFKHQTTNVPILKKNYSSSTISSLTASLWLYSLPYNTEKKKNPFGISGYPIIHQCNLITFQYDHSQINPSAFVWLSSTKQFNMNYRLPHSEWVHLVIILDGENHTVALYADTMLIKSHFDADIKPFNAESIQIAVGNDADPVSGQCVIDDVTQCMVGSITEFYVWDRVLSENDIGDAFKHRPDVVGALFKWEEFRPLVQGPDVVIDEYPF